MKRFLSMLSILSILSCFFIFSGFACDDVNQIPGLVVSSLPDATSQADTASNPPSDGTAASNPPSDGTAASNPPSDGTAASNPPSDGTAASNPPSDGTVASNPPSDGTAASDPPSDETAASNPPSDGTIADTASNPMRLALNWTSNNTALVNRYWVVMRPKSSPTADSAFWIASISASVASDVAGRENGTPPDPATAIIGGTLKGIPIIIGGNGGA